MLYHPDLMGVDALAEKIRKIPNFPQEGILFHDITPVLQSPEYFRLLIDLLTYRYMGQQIDVVTGLDARGFIMGAALAYQLNVGFVPIRKKRQITIRNHLANLRIGIRRSHCGNPQRCHQTCITCAVG